MSQHYLIERIDKRKWFPKSGIGNVSSQGHVIYNGGWTKKGFTLSDPISQRLILSCEPVWSWRDIFHLSGAEVFETDQTEICRIQYSVRKLKGELIINERAYSLKPEWTKHGVFKRASCKYEWEVCSLDLSYDDGMCVANIMIEDDIDHLPFIAAAYYLWMHEDLSD